MYICLSAKKELKRQVMVDVEFQNGKSKLLLSFCVSYWAIKTIPLLNENPLSLSFQQQVVMALITHYPPRDCPCSSECVFSHCSSRSLEKPCHLSLQLHWVSPRRYACRWLDTSSLCLVSPLFSAAALLQHVDSELLTISSSICLLCGFMACFF